MIFPTSYPLFPPHSISALSYGYPMVYHKSSYLTFVRTIISIFILHSFTLSFFHSLTPLQPLNICYSYVIRM